MILIIGRLRIPQRNQADFVAHARALIPRERQVPGCAGFDLLHDVNDPDAFVMLERWQDRAALDRHLKSEEFAHNEEGLSRFLDGEPTWEEYEI